MKLNYIAIPAIILITSVAGSSFTSSGMGWYKTIDTPSWTPPGAVIGIVWTVIYVLTGISAFMVFNKTPRDATVFAIGAVFILNAIANAGWSYVFFGIHRIGPAILVSGLIEITVLALILLIWKRSAMAAALLIPYAAWVCFATYLTFCVWNLNK